MILTTLYAVLVENWGSRDVVLRRGGGEPIEFIIAAGASVADGMMFYYRDNLFRLYGLSATLRDVAEKAYLAQQDLERTLQDGFRLSSFAARSYPSPDQYLHPAWSHVDQPVLAMWGELDQNVPVGESVAGLKNSLAHANNEKWTVIILLQASHSLQISETEFEASGAFLDKPAQSLAAADA